MSKGKERIHVELKLIVNRNRRTLKIGKEHKELRLHVSSHVGLGERIKVRTEHRQKLRISKRNEVSLWDGDM
jgi:hypothetical protein